MTCSATPTSSDLTFLPEDHPTAGTSGTAFLPDAGSVGEYLLPEVSPLTINCVEVVPLAVGGVALDGELRGIAAQDGGAPWLWAALGFGAIVAISALAVARQRVASR